jgi:hypothetical protein
MYLLKQCGTEPLENLKQDKCQQSFRAELHLAMYITSRFDDMETTYSIPGHKFVCPVAVTTFALLITSMLCN